MKILHICFEAPYIDGWGYQENLIPKYHLKMGHDVTVIASLDLSPEYLGKVEDEIKKLKEYSFQGVRIIRLAHSFNIMNKLVWYKGFSETLSKEKPNVIYLHGIQSASLLTIRRYIKQNPGCRFIVDAHGDYYNSAKGFLSRVILHGVVWRLIIGIVHKYIDRIFAVTPNVAELLNQLYKIPKEDITLLPLGGEYDQELLKRKSTIRNKIRENLKISDTDFVIINAGRIRDDIATHILIKAVKFINNSKIHVIVVGSIDSNYKNVLKEAWTNCEQIHYIGWVPSNEIPEYYLAADIAVFPGGQSVLWQQAICCGLPAIFTAWPGTNYLNVGGNALFIVPSENTDDMVKHLMDAITTLIDEPLLLEDMNNIATTKGVENFSYERIAEKCLK